MQERILNSFFCISCGDALAARECVSAGHTLNFVSAAVYASFEFPGGEEKRRYEFGMSLKTTNAKSAPLFRRALFTYLSFSYYPLIAGASSATGAESADAKSRGKL
jgi:hypothetical protein